MAGDRQFYLKRSYEKAFGQFDEANWNPQLGFAANEARILKLYDYYRDTYLARPAIGSENFFTQTMVRVGKEIFHDLAWQHEAFLDDESNAVKLAAYHDMAKSAKKASYYEAWRHILSRDEERVAIGNKMLLWNEQFTIIQPLYDQIMGSPEGMGFFYAPMRSVKAFTNSIHPYHRDFLLSLPTGDIVKAADRWSWITETGGMWEKWGEKRGVPAAPIAMSRTERTRLVSLSMDKIIKREFAPVDQTLMPPGAFDI